MGHVGPSCKGHVTNLETKLKKQAWLRPKNKLKRKRKETQLRKKYEINLRKLAVILF